MRPTTVTASREEASLQGIVGDLAAVVHAAYRQPHVPGDRSDGLRGVAREHLHLDALAAQERNRLADVRPQLLGEHDEAERLEIRGG